MLFQPLLEFLVAQDAAGPLVLQILAGHTTPLEEYALLAGPVPAAE